jgi:DNA-binding Lrp family transcriptional regulator
MTSAFVLANCHFPFDTRIKEQISMMQQVVAVYRTEGRYDLIFKVKAESEENLEEMISMQINKLSGIDGTILLITKEQFDKAVIS